MEVAGWRLQQLYPGRIVKLHNLAIGGQNLRQAINGLHKLETRPDLLLVYSGHNEFYQDMEEILITAESPFHVLDPLANAVADLCHVLSTAVAAIRNARLEERHV